MRTIGIVTVGRSDYSLYFPLLKKIESHHEFNLHIIASGTHLSPEFGQTIKLIEYDGFAISDKVEMLLSSDTPESISKSMGLGLIGFSQSFTRFRPDILIVLGDRFEMYSAAIAALPFRIPVAHIHGGELTMGAIDDSLRHSITKMSHLHFVSTREYANRVMQLGEEPWRITISGALSLENLYKISLMNIQDLENRYNLLLDKPPILVTFHPVTLEHDQARWQIEELLAALSTCDLPIVFTMSNADTNGRVINQIIKDFVDSQEKAHFVDNLGMQGYFSMMAASAVMVGNSSSGIIEAASFYLPVVNIGSRQNGRIKDTNVIDVGYNRDEIGKAISRAIDPEFRAGLSSMKNSYDHGASSEIITQVLKQIPLDDRLTTKDFYDIHITPAEQIKLYNSNVALHGKEASY